MSKHWDKIKIPPVGFSDGMVTYKNSIKGQHKDKSYAEFKEDVLKEIKPTAAVPRYVKVIAWCLYAEVWLGIKKEHIEGIYKTDEKKDKWEQALKLFPDCFKPATKLEWNLRRNHGTPSTPETPTTAAIDFDWDSYNRSIKMRAEEVRNKNSNNG